MPGVKYIAAGFIKDAETLLTEFVKENSPEFSVFTHFWKKHNFAAVFLGRSSSELQQFTHEIFQLTLKFLVTADIIHQIGGVYLLYALFRNQIVEPPTRIRVVLNQYQHLMQLRKVAINEKYKTLHYVIGYLLENGLDLVAHPILVGPKNSKYNAEMEKKTLQMQCMLKDLKNHSLSLFENNALQEIQELDEAYSELTQNLPFEMDMDKEPINLNMEAHMRELARLIGVEKNEPGANTQSEKECDNIGQRRAQIKSDAFASRAWFRQLNPTDEDEDEENARFTRSRAQRISLIKKAKLTKDSENEEDEEYEPRQLKVRRRRRLRIPKERRRMGRPKKGQVLEQMLMEDDVVSDAKKEKGFRKRGPVARTGYLVRYIEQPFNGANAEITMLSSSSEEEEEAVDEPDEVITLEDDDDATIKEENRDESEEVTKLQEENMDELDEALTF